MKRQCVRCGVHIKEETNKIWCKNCMDKVMEDLRGEKDRPFEYYFKYHLKRCRKENREMYQQKEMENSFSYVKNVE